MSPPSTLSGKSVLVTGAGSGIGRAAAIMFARAGAYVTVVDRDADAGQLSVDRIHEESGHAGCVVADVSLAADVRRMLETAAEMGQGLDVIVNNAGVQYAGDVVDFGEAEWDELMAVNAKSCFLTAKYGVPYLRRRGGAIVNNASLAGIRAAPGLGAYAASKGAIVAFSKTLAVEMAPLGIRVNVVCPGWTDTTFNRPSIEHMGGASELEAFTRANIPLGRLGTPDEIAAAIVFLASEESSYMTGQLLVIDGGIN